MGLQDLHGPSFDEDVAKVVRQNEKARHGEPGGLKSYSRLGTDNARSLCGPRTLIPAGRKVCWRLREHHVGALAVMEGNALVGIISECGVIVRVIAVVLDRQLTLIRAVMPPDPQTIDAEECLADALQMRLDGHFRHLPVTQEG